jgi:hypothetical protein
MSALPYSVSAVIPYQGEFVVELYINGEFWDHRTFATEAEAEAFRSDPLAQDRAREQRRRKPELDRSYVALGTRISRGRRIGKKPHAA